MKPRFLFAAFAAVYASYSAGAQAQAFLGDPRLSEGNGIRAGAFELHPGVAAEGGYDSNYFQLSGRGKGTSGLGEDVPADKLASPSASGNNFYTIEDRIKAFRLRITPSLSFTTFGKREAMQGGGPPPNVIFGGRLAASYNALFGIDTSSLQSDQVSSQNNVALIGGLNVNVLPQGKVGVDGSVDYVRIVEASNDPGTPNAFRRDTIRGGVGVNWRPGGGLFNWRLGYGITANLFEEDAFKPLNNIQHRIETQGRWKFLPRTAIFYRGDVSWLDYFEANSPNSLSGGLSVRSALGLNGLITNYFGMLVMGGWTSSFYEPKGDVQPRNYDNFIGQAELTWYPTPQKKLPEGGAPVGLSQVSLGYVRAFSPSYLGSFYQRDRGYLNFIYFFGQRFVAVLSGGINHITRPESFFPGGERQYIGGSENRLDGQLFVEYRPGAAVGINATLRYDGVLGEVPVKTAPTTGAGLGTRAADGIYDDLGFDRYQAFLGVRWFL